MRHPDIEGLTDFMEVGRGGFSTVYRARQVGAGRDVAVKVLHAQLDETTTPRFTRECETLGALSNHPSICTLYSFGQTESGSPFLMLELCDGSLTDRLATQGAMGWQEVADVLRAIGGAAQAAHDRGVLHRDIKPQNVLLTAYGQPVLSDFGIARLDDGWQTTTGMVTASIAHAAPEVIEGEAATTASDVWSLASTGYTLLLGKPPFHQETDQSAAAMLNRVFRAEPPDLRGAGVPDWLCNTLEAGMQKAPTDRIDTAASFVAGLSPGSSGAAEAMRSPSDTTVIRPRSVVHKAPTDETVVRALSDAARTPPSTAPLYEDTITTVAGAFSPSHDTPGISVGLHQPESVTVHPDGRIVIADTFNHRICAIELDGRITTLAGTGKSGAAGDHGPATDAELSFPSGLAVGSDGSILVAERGNHRIRAILPSGTITTIAGTGRGGSDGDEGPAINAQLFWPTGITVDANDTAIIADTFNNLIRAIRPDGTITTIAGVGPGRSSYDTGASFNKPESVAVHPDGRILVADRGNHRVAAILNGTVTTVAGTGTGGFSGDHGPAASAQLFWPAGVAVDARGRIIVADTFNNRVRAISLDGTITTIAGTGDDGASGDDGPATSARLFGPSGIAVHPDGRVLIADLRNNRIRAILPK